VVVAVTDGNYCRVNEESAATSTGGLTSMAGYGRTSLYYILTDTITSALLVRCADGLI
jgi:hypothetical protein